MSGKGETRRVLIALTEASPLAELWRTAIERLGEAPAELVAVFVSDDRWRRAASLSFTHEISRVGGRATPFTPQRAEQVDSETVSDVERQVQALAAESNLQLVFEILSEHEPGGIDRLIGVGSSLLIAPSHIKARPIYSELMRLNCEVLLVEAVEAEAENRDRR